MASKIFFKSVFIAVFMISLLSHNAQAQEMEEVIANLTETLDLSEKQVGELQGLMVNYRGKLDDVLVKYEGEEEPDVAAMIGEIRDVRDGYRKDLKGILSQNQYDTYMNGIDAILTDMFNDLAEIRLMDVQDDAALTDGQLESLVPIMGNGLKQTVQLLFENAGGRLSLPKKIKIGKTMKKIEKEQRAAMEQILTPDQMAAYDENKAKQKEARKNKK